MVFGRDVFWEWWVWMDGEDGVFGGHGWWRWLMGTVFGWRWKQF